MSEAESMRGAAPEPGRFDGVLGWAGIEQLPLDVVVKEVLMPADGAGRPKAPFKASWWTVPAGASSPVESHDVHELWLVAAGRGSMTYGDERLAVRSGDVVYVTPGRPHEVESLGPEPLEVFSVWWP